MDLLWQVPLVLFVIFLGRFVFSKNSGQARVLDIYSLPGKWFYVKYVLMYSMLTVRKISTKISSKKGAPGFGVQSHDFPTEMDKVQPLSKDPKAFDAVYFNAANRIGWHLVIGFGRRADHVDGIFILKVPGVGVLVSPKLPDTVIAQSPDHLDHYSSAGLVITPVEPMRSWHIEFNGKLRLLHNSHKKFRVHLDARWQSDLPFFNYDTDFLTKNMAKSLSLEVWTSNYFKGLRELHQTHYEQFGHLSGNVTIDDVDFNLNLSSMRDHSFGVRRVWKAYHRYSLHVISLADGRCGTVGIASAPSVFSRMEFGYMYGRDGSIEATCDLDFDLYHYGENGTPPTDYGFTFLAGNETYEVKVHVEESIELFLGLEWEVRIVENLCRFTVNGVEGWGAAEWMYSHASGRPQTAH